MPWGPLYSWHMSECIHDTVTLPALAAQPQVAQQSQQPLVTTDLFSTGGNQVPREQISHRKPLHTGQVAPLWSGGQGWTEDASARAIGGAPSTAHG